MELSQLQAIIEGALLAAGEPLTIKKLETLFDEEDVPEKAQFEQALEAIADACEARGFELKEVASGWRFQVREDLAPWVNRLWEEKPQKYSRALLETLALIAYRQPITRGDIEEIRGVAVSSHIIKTLTERDWVKVVGQRDVPGRPSLYATTRQFLDYFNLKSLDQLPTLSEIRDLDEINSALDLGDASGSDEPEALTEIAGGLAETEEQSETESLIEAESPTETEGPSAIEADDVSDGDAERADSEEAAEAGFDEDTAPESEQLAEDEQEEAIEPDQPVAGESEIETSDDTDNDTEFDDAAGDPEALVSVDDADSDERSV